MLLAALAGAVGLTAGAGRIPLAALATAVVLVVLSLITLFEKPGEAERTDD